jgi:hypothetical protein
VCPASCLEEARRAVSKGRPGPHHEGPVSKGRSLIFQQPVRSSQELIGVLIGASQARLRKSADGLAHRNLDPRNDP